MFSYIRWFSRISFILVVLSTITGGYYFKEMISRDFVAIIENNNTLVAQGYINTIWKEYHKQAKSLTEQYKQILASHNTTSQDFNKINLALDDFSKRSLRYFENMPIAGVRIYTTDSIKFVSIDQPGIAGYSYSHSSITTGSGLPKIQKDNKAFLTSLTGVVASSLLEDQLITNQDGTKSHGFIISTFIPIMRDNSAVPAVISYNRPGETNIACTDTNVLNCVEGVIEIHYNSTEQLRNLDLFRQLSTSAIIILFMIIIFILYFTSNKAEAMVAKQHETNIELAAQAVSAQAENRNKSQFLANVSHELRTPLNAIVGFSEFIKLERSGPVTNKKYAEYIKDIYDSGVHLLNLINDILDYSKAEADKLELDISEIDITKTLRNTIRLITPQAEGGQVKLKEDMPNDHLTIKTDSKKLKQVMLNLLSNAVKFTPPGGSVTVSMWQNAADGSISIEVRDTGIGIEPKDIPRAIAPFGQIDSTLARKYKGTGLGLPLTRKLIEIMGGTFNIQSETGKGTTVVVCLPKEAKNRNIVL